MRVVSLRIFALAQRGAVSLPAVLIGALAVLAVAGVGRVASACSATDKACLYKKYQGHKVRTPGFWREMRDRPLEARIAVAPADVVDFLALDNLIQNIPSRPKRSAVTDDFIADVRAAIADLPANIRSVMERRVVAIVFVDDLGGTAYADIVRWGVEDGAVFIVLDPTQLSSRRANEWATWKEGTPFRADPAWAIDARIANPDNDTWRNAISYILLHELGHALATRGDVHPRWDRPPQEELRHARFPLYALSWTLNAAGTQQLSRFDTAFPDRAKVRYYFGAQLDAASMEAAYRWLATTNFPTLYAATSPGDDFAESFVSYVHTELMQRPWSVTLKRNGATVLDFRACWNEPRCAEKRVLLEAIIAAETGAQGVAPGSAASPAAAAK